MNLSHVFACLSIAAAAFGITVAVKDCNSWSSPKYVKATTSSRSHEVRISVWQEDWFVTFNAASGRTFVCNSKDYYTTSFAPEVLIKYQERDSILGDTPITEVKIVEILPIPADPDKPFTYRKPALPTKGPPP